MQVTPDDVESEPPLVMTVVIVVLSTASGADNASVGRRIDEMLSK